MSKHRGGLWESSEWELLFDKEIDITSHNGPKPNTPEREYVCPHASQPVSQAHRRGDGSVWLSWSIVVPRVVQQWNEGGYCTTGVCADCVLEALQVRP